MEKTIQDILKLVEGDKGKLAEFLGDPKALLEKHNIDFNPEKMKDIVEAVGSKVNLGELIEKGEGLLEGIQGLFHKAD